MGAFHDLRWFLQKYVTSAFGTNSPSFEEERKQILDEPGAFFQEPMLEPLPEYKTGSHVKELDQSDLPGLSASGRCSIQGIGVRGFGARRVCVVYAPAEICSNKACQASTQLW